MHYLIAQLIKLADSRHQLPLAFQGLVESQTQAIRQPLNEWTLASPCSPQQFCKLSLFTKDMEKDVRECFDAGQTHQEGLQAPKSELLPVGNVFHRNNILIRCLEVRGDYGMYLLEDYGLLVQCTVAQYMRDGSVVVQDEGKVSHGTS